MLFVPLSPGNDSRDVAGAPFVAGFARLGDRSLTMSVGFFSPTLTLYVPPARALDMADQARFAHPPVPRLRAQMEGLEPPCEHRITGMKW